jgi:two-component system, chemotaxis family, chemotaxis protein CheY
MHTVLIVDDSATVRALVRSALEADGHAVVEAANGAAALAALEGADAPDLVVTDLIMPEMDGLALIRALRADTRHRGLPILVLTTESGDAVKASGRDAGATGWLGKPFHPDTLRRTVRRVLEPPA